MKNKEKNKKQKNYFKYVVIAAVLLIPFMYSFFYLKAYWNPYGKGNIDNLPVAIVNDDSGDKGSSLVKSIKDSKKLKISVVSKDKAEDGLYNKKYYAVITIPSDFTSSMESASTTNKHHPVITYSPNQKSNYLASQIINSVVNAVEKNLDNEINSTIVESLSENIESVPDQLNTISDGFSKLKDGTSELSNGGSSLESGSKSLYAGTTQIKKSLSSSISSLNSDLTDSEKNQILQTISSSEELSDTAIANKALQGLQSNSSYIELKTKYNNAKQLYEQTLSTNNLTDEIISGCIKDSTSSPYCAAPGVPDLMNAKTQISTLESVISSLETVAKQTAVQTAKTVSQQVALQTAASTKKQAVTTTKESLNTLLSYINKVDAGASQLSNGSTTLKNGLTTLNNSVSSAKDELDSKITTTKTDVKKVESLSDYSKEPVKLKTKEVNKISSYGTAFSPFFISIALWVGCLMMYIVLYYDKEERFEVFGIQNKNYLQRSLAYHGLVTVSAIILGILLQLLLDFTITNIFLYYIAIILTANMFMAIIEFLIVNFGDIGKFVALILLVLQLAAAGGTFPIETVTKGFRFLNNFLPMKYTINILREALISIESNILVKNTAVVIIIFVVFLVINIINDIRKTKKA